MTQPNLDDDIYEDDDKGGGIKVTLGTLLFVALVVVCILWWVAYNP